MHVCSEKSAVKEIHVSIFLSSLDAFLLSFMIQTKFHPYSPMMDFFFKKSLLSEEVFNKMNIFGFIFFKKKSNLVQKSQNIFSSV